VNCDDAISLTPLPRGGSLSLRVDAAQPPEADVLLMAVWEHMCAANPRLFNAPMLALDRAEHIGEGTTLHARLETYQRFAAQGMMHVSPQVEQLSVTGVLLAKDAAGVEHVLLGKRGRGVRVYADQWELGPSGGVDAPSEAGIDAALALTVDEAYLREQLQGEMTEELGRTPPIASMNPVALVHDRFARSCDVVYEVQLACEPWATATGDEASWEYGDTVWVPTAGIAAFVREHDNIIPPSLVIFRFFGWTR
jgi:hypothetical protein